MAATVERQFPAEKNVKDGARNDAVKLLPRPKDIGGAREHDRKAIVPDERAQMQLAAGARSCIRRARIEGRVFGYIPAAASINFRRGNVDILFQEIEPA